jgi:O-acetylhomoserine/O-acetylserine sulfhydrylase-like pyridoxal-dependent enzyme
MSDDGRRLRHLETEVIHQGEGARAGAAPVTTPIYATTTFEFESTAEFERYLAG